MGFNMMVVVIGRTSPEVYSPKRTSDLTPLMGFNMKVVEIRGTSPGAIFYKIFRLQA